MNRARVLAAAVHEALASNKNEKNKMPMEAYMKHHFSFFGIKAPDRRLLCRPIWKEYRNIEEAERMEAAKLLFDMEERECHYAAIELLERGTKKTLPSAIDGYKQLLETKPWWDTVDPIASKLCGAFFLRYPDFLRPVTEEWSRSETMWLRRSSLLHQLRYKEKTDRDLLYHVIHELKEEREFFIEKAIGWALREYSKTAPEAVLLFVESHPLRPLSRREALKWMKAQGMLDV
ncbi:DNA alkylation repair protein [Halobacillus sp. BAB-2008]|uniref:DNA alkylation repair protein n=1 Tax=Halobacillus sp. BAB-2008 TaxID=1246484 RepID=UPI0002A4D2E3|nr:DNA alkylation repair protein [Halobacillus sp. BAB-2008]ELK44577.1 hypothetical protein D479_18484 [Halobacillus sp. BAB-2008]